MKFVLVMLFPLLLVRGAFGLSSGPVQPEFLSFEPVDVTDLVNLPTGDFTYVVPLGDVKGPAGVGYPLTLSYHAGIANEQEASFVGLGWSMNVGSIVRAVRGFPDDYAGEQVSSYLHNDGKDGWAFNLGGGWGPISGTVGFTDRGFEGLTEISFGYSGGVGPLRLSAGMSMNTQGGVGFSTSAGFGSFTNSYGVILAEGSKPVWYTGIGLSSDGSGTSMAGFSIASNGHSGFSVGGASMSYSPGFNSSGLSRWSGSFGMTIPLPHSFRVDFAYSWWGWNYRQLTFDNAWGYLYQSPNMLYQVETPNLILAKLLPENQWNYASSAEMGNGVPGRNSGKGKKDRLESLCGREGAILSSDNIAGSTNAFNLSSQDLYTVNSQGLGGRFKPVTFRSMTALASPEDETYDNLFGIPGSDGSIQTYYNNSEMKISQRFQDGMVFKMMGETGMNLVDNPGSDAELDYYSKNRYGNIDLDGNDATKPLRTCGTRIEPLFNLDPGQPSKLQGFVITDQEGKTYWYTYALYSYGQVSYVNDHESKPQGGFRPGGNFSYRKENGQYATTWLLTAVTGPDYVKRTVRDDWDTPAEGLLPHQGDWGYWVAFRYEYGAPVTLQDGLPSVVQSEDEDGVDATLDRALCGWREPYSDAETEAQYGKQVHKSGPCPSKSRYSATYGTKDITYLRSVETPTEIAYLRTSSRLDGIGIATADYPRYNEAMNPANVVGYETTNTYYQNVANAEKARLAADIVPNGKIVTELGDCMRIEFPCSQYPQYTAEYFRALSPGTAIAQLEFASKIEMVNSRGNKRYHRHAHNRLVVAWDSYGWDYSTKQWNQSQKCEGDPGFSPIVLNATPGSYDFNWTQVEIKNRPFDFHYAMNVAKCFHAEFDPGSDPSTADDKVVLYVLGYSRDLVWPTGNSSTTIRTGCVTSWKYRTSNDWIVYHTYAVDDIHCTGGDLLLDNQDIPRGVELARYSKKLDEIAWYSKAEYPYLDPMTDPGADGAKEGFMDAFSGTGLPYPQSYNRVKFRYNYELARNTPNSIDEGTKMRGGGRLTLKEVRREAGPENASVAMPPYLFDYQGTDANYLSYADADNWGFRKVPPPTGGSDPSLTDPSTGVVWNLKRIQLPSCGSIEVELERDHSNSVFGTLYRMRKEAECHPWNIDAGEGVGALQESPQMYPVSPNASYYWNGSAASYVYGETTMRVTMSSDDQILQPGMYFIVDFSAVRDGTPYDQVFFTPRMTAVAPVSGRVYDVTFDRDLPIAHPEDYPSIRIRVLKHADLYCDGVRTKSVRTASLGGMVNETVYSYPEDGGTIEVLPHEAVPEELNFGMFVVGSVFLNRQVISRPFSADIIENYNTGNVSVLYPFVETIQAKVDDNGSVVIDASGNIVKTNGSTKCTFWTINDRVTPANETQAVDLISKQTMASFADDVGVRLVTDRSAIVGLVKEAQWLDNNGTIVRKIENTYGFSEELSDNVAPYSRPGVLNGTPDTRLSADKPLGLVRERTIRMQKNGANYRLCSVYDVTTSRPYLTKTAETVSGVRSTTSYGLFDANTGTPMATLVAGPNASRLDVSVPNIYLLSAASDAASLAALNEKNILTLPGVSITASSSALPLTIRSLIAYSNNSFVKSAGQTYVQETVPAAAGVTFSQSRFRPDRSYRWSGGSFEFPNIDPTGWAPNEEVHQVDAYSRLTSEEDAAHVSQRIFYHPMLNAVTGVVKGATGGSVRDLNNFDECAAFTCDYDDYTETTDQSGSLVDDGSFDASNGWRKLAANSDNVAGIVRLAAEDHHFGNKCIYVENAYGPIKTSKIYSGKPYKLSAWVRVVSGSAKLVAECRTGTAPDQLDALDPDNAFTTVGSASGEWVLLQKTITSRTAVANKDWYVRIWVGSDNANVKTYVDDIRFAPADAQVATYYYDQNLGVPIAIVDANNAATYYKYDAFGRLIEKGVVQD